MRANALVLAVLSAMLSACNAYSGKYIREGHPSDVLELRSDNTFFVTQGGMSMAGTYEIHGSEIILKTGMGFADRGHVEGKTIIDSDNIRWTRGYTEPHVAVTAPPPPTPEQHVQSAVDLLNNGEFDRALAELTQADAAAVRERAKTVERDIRARASATHRASAEDLFQRQQYDAAIEECNRALNYLPTDAAALELKAKIQETKRILGGP